VIFRGVEKYNKPTPQQSARSILRVTMNGSEPDYYYDGKFILKSTYKRTPLDSKFFYKEAVSYLAKNEMILVKARRLHKLIKTGGTLGLAEFRLLATREARSKSKPPAK
jgi:hypothetical protein